MSSISESQIKRSRGYNAGARIFKNSLKSVLNSCKNSSEERNVHLCSNEIVIKSPISNIEDESKPIEKKSYSMNVWEKTYDVQQNTDCISANDNEFPLISGKSKNVECKSHTVNHIYSEDSSFCTDRSDANNYSLPLTPNGISLSHIFEEILLKITVFL
ncbi:hypothetical protein CEXT_62451 [Caerostris extrusa]|uniref:Uncharacterized protein n=1 Tax=Caerostris extrusa TaxID=172846 RepID=A0AAV4XQ03_CAEEX|nr:hypothetical protein CEXT_62451 [Caerostris extrusa]